VRRTKKLIAPRKFAFPVRVAADEKMLAVKLHHVGKIPGEVVVAVVEKPFFSMRNCAVQS
jgi:hypothetical protein